VQVGGTPRAAVSSQCKQSQLARSLKQIVVRQLGWLGHESILAEAVDACSAIKHDSARPGCICRFRCSSWPVQPDRTGGALAARV